MAIASQLRVVHSSLNPKFSFCDGLRYLLHLMRRSRPGCVGEGAVEGQSNPVLFVLHDFEQFTFRPKQTLLYSLFDLMQTEDAQMAVVGLTTRIDCADLLEKRVRSRCSQRQLLVPPLENIDDCTRLLQRALTLPNPADMPASGFATKAAAFYSAWSANTRALLTSLGSSTLLRRRLGIGVSAGQLQVALRFALSELRPERPLLTLPMLEAAMTAMSDIREEKTLGECSGVELLLLLCLKNIVVREVPPPHSFQMVLREYESFLAADPDSTSQYNYPRALLSKAFEHLCTLGLVLREPEAQNRNKPNDHLPLRLRIDAQLIHDYVNTASLPTAVRRFIKAPSVTMFGAAS
uniref:Origin recognition complex subunit 4 C-terminal domain-containing protein n=1 Tax=Haptolina brevifila TaxID=156173 RepID=A0A7S2IKV5_9EUKA